ncbi:MAG TPA: 3'-5' exonuclease [Gemmataceae bacterium]|nr:3'-5' exonuclease [Gemmataceae bacterium]
MQPSPLPRPQAGPPCFVAIDFETADRGNDSACAVGLVRVAGAEIVHRAHFLIRPPRRTSAFTYVHGITWAHVAQQPTFAELWPRLREHLGGADFLAAHNAAFDRSVLKACCERAGLPVPDLRFECSMRLARDAWGLRPTKLPDVCRRLGIPLRHHDPLSDAEACARIVLAASGRST